MNAPTLPNVMYLSDDQKHQTIENIGALKNLLYLIALDACDPALVRDYAYQAEGILQDMETQMIPRS